MNYSFTRKQIGRFVTGVLGMLAFLCFAFISNAQTTISTTHIQTTGASSITFNVENANSYPINVVSVQCYLNSIATHNYSILYNPTKIKSNGASWSQGQVGDGLNGWVLGYSGSVTNTATGVATLTDSMVVTIPPNSTYGFCISDNSVGYRALTAGAGVNKFTSNGVSIVTGDSIGFGGGAIPMTPVNYPRGFVGGISFVNAPCVAAVSIVSDNTSICSGNPVTFTAKPTFGGTSPTYQWYKNGASITGATGITYTATNLKSTDSIQCYLTSNASCATNTTAISNSIKTTVVASGASPGVSITANPSTTIALGSLVTFTASQTLGGSAPTYQWKKNGVNVGTNSITYTDTSLASGDVVTCTLTSNAACATPKTVTSAGLTITTFFNYCTPTAGCTGNDYISQVDFNTISRASTCDNGGYSFFSDSTNSTTVTQGDTVNLSVSTSTLYKEGVVAWIDFNQNGVFDSTEMIINDLGTATGATYSKDIAIPYDAKIGLTRLRVRCFYNAIPGHTPCTTYQYGETEDYTVNILKGNCTANIAIASNAGTSVCTGDSVLFTSTVDNGGTTPTYQWKKNGTNITGATSPTYKTNNLISSDAITCQLTSNASCAVTSVVNSNSIKTTITSASIVPTITISTVPSTSSAIAAGTLVTFSASATLTGNSPAYVWKKNGIVVGSNSATYKDSTLASGDVVNCTLTSSSNCASPKSVTSAGVTITTYLNYCKPTSSCTSSDYISQVDFNTISRASTCDSSGYSFFNDSTNTTTVTQGDTVNLSVSTSALYKEGVAAWIDFNQNGTFDSTEMIINDLGTTVGAVYSKDIAIPYDAKTGQTRLRVRCRYNTIPGNTPCTNYTYGETEDYVVNILKGNCTASIVIASNAGTSVCTGDSVLFTSTIYNGGTTPTYQWKKNGTSITGATSPTYKTNNLTSSDAITCQLTSTASCAVTPVVNSNSIKTNITTASIVPTIAISTTPSTSTAIAAGTLVTFTATAKLTGNTPVFVWKKNGIVVGTNSAIYKDSTLASGDVVTCTLTSSSNCASPKTVTSTGVTITTYLNYCKPTSSCTGSDYISQVDFNTISRTSVCDSSGYSFFNDSTNTTTVSQGDTVNLSVSTSTVFKEGVVAWIDFNQNGVFDSTEMVLNDFLGTTGAVYSKDIAIPYDAKVGQTRLRVRCRYNVIPGHTPCTAYTYGETEDYSVIITKGNCNSTISISSNAGTSVCPGDTVLFTSTIAFGGTSPSYQWKKNNVNVSGATSPTYKTASLTSSDVITCALTSSATCAVSPTVVSNSIQTTVTSASLAPTITVTSSPSLSNPIAAGTTVVFTAVVTLPGNAPVLVWKKNGISVGSNSLSYTDSTLSTGDIITCTLTSTSNCATPKTVKSANLTVTSYLNYCTPTSSCTSSDYISQIDFNTISRASTCDSTGYSYFSDSSNSTTVSRGDTVNLSVSTSTAFKQGVVAWIDFNQNGKFDSTEMVINELGTAAGAVYSKDVAIPSNAKLGQTRLRVRCKYNSVPGNTPCDNYNYGETEDYLINITSSSIAQYVVTGGAHHPNGSYIPTVTASLNGTNYLVTDAQGNYNYTIPSTGTYNIKLSKNNDKTKSNGVTVIDALLVQGHILNKTILNSPYKLIAADVNHSNDVSVIDIIYMKRLILGQDTTFAGNRLWAFVDSAYVFPNAAKPFPYKDSILLTNPSANLIGQSFIGVKLGDVNYDWNPALLGVKTTNTKPLELYYNDINVGSSNEIRVPIKVKNFKDLLGLQYTLNFNTQSLELKAIENASLNIEYGIKQVADGKIAFLWNDDKLNATSLNDGTTLFELVFNRKAGFVEEDLRISSDVATIEAWDANFKLHNIVKTNGKLSSTAENVRYTESWNVTPNPSDGIVRLNLSLTTGKELQFELTNVEGKVLVTKKLSGVKGNSSTILNFKEQSKLAAGVYYIRSSGIDAQNVKQLIIK